MARCPAYSNLIDLIILSILTERYELLAHFQGTYNDQLLFVNPCFFLRLDLECGFHIQTAIYVVDTRFLLTLI